MKLLFDFEDTAIGIAIGAVLLAQTGRYFTLPYTEVLLIILIPLAGVFAVLDIVHHLKDIGANFFGFLLINGHNVLNLALFAGYLTYRFGLAIPYVGPLAEVAFTQFTFLLSIYFIGGYLAHFFYERFVL